MAEARAPTLVRQAGGVAMNAETDAVLERCQRLQAALAKQTAALADISEQWRRMQWRAQALGAGFAPEQAARLAFWRWIAERRGDTAGHRPALAEGAAPPA